VTNAAHFGPASEAPRRRAVTILFSDLSESTRIAGSLEAEDYGDLLERLRAIYHGVVAKRDGVIAQISGDGMLAAFGYPEPREDDARRAVEAALDLRDSVRALGSEDRWRQVAPRLHSGIHAGRVLFTFGDEVRGRFELLGRPTNIASRLCGAAGPDEILVSETTLGPERHYFEANAAGRLRLRGKDEPVPTLTVLGRSAIGSRYAASERAGLTPFVGREKELLRLEHGLDRVVRGGSLLIEIRGPPGEGKTRLAEELLRHSAEQGCQVHRGECDDTAEPLQPFLQIARSIFAPLPPQPGEEAARRAGELLAQIDPGLLAQRAAWLRLLSLGGEDVAPDEATAVLPAVLRGLARQRPLVLFIDDWHAADDASRSMLVGLRGIGGLLILMTARPDPAGVAQIDDADEVLRLPPLSEAETAQVVGRLLPAPDPFLIADISDSSGGNPLFIEELCHAIASGGADELRGGTCWLEMLVQARLSRLPQEQADLVRAASVIGNVIPAWLFALICGRDAADPVVAGLAEQDFVFPGEREGILRFKHGLTREIVYQSVGLHERTAMHLQIAEALRSGAPDHGEDEPYEALAYHYGAGGDAAATARYAELAGDKAAAISALDRAQAQYRAALAALDRLPPSTENAAHWARIAQRFGRAGVFDPSREQLPILERAVEMAAGRRDQAALGSAEYWLGYINYALGEPAAAMAHYQRALEAASSAGDRRLAAQVRAALGQVRQAACDYEGALPLLDEAIEAKRRSYSGAGPQIGIAYSLSCKAFALGDMGRFDEAHAFFEEAMAAIGGSLRGLEPSVLDQRSAVCLWQGRMEDALRFAEEAERTGERIRSFYDVAMSRALAGYARWKMERAPAALQAIVDATIWLEEGGRYQNISLNYGWLAEIMTESGRIPEARKYAARALRRARKCDPMGEAMALRAMARAAARLPAGRKPAGHYLRRAMASARARSAPHEVAVTLLCEAELALDSGEPEIARVRLADARRTFAALGMIWHEREAISLAHRLEAG
jgi:class 3 adenylate cyclase/tetratricopeptide (TPR) repeat protein